MKNSLLAALAFALFFGSFAQAEGTRDDELLVQLVAGNLAKIQRNLPEPLKEVSLQAETLRCVAFRSSMLGSCIIRGVRQGRYPQPMFFQIGVKQSEDEGYDGVVFEARLLLDQAW